MKTKNISFIRRSSWSEMIERFKTLLEACCEISDRLGVPFKPYRTADLEHFRALPSVEQQQQAIHYLEIFYKILKINERDQSADSLEGTNRREMWSAISFLGWRPDSNLFSVIEDDDKIEIYNSEGIQIWRNFNMMRVCSYTLEEVYCLTWEERYERDIIDTEKIHEAVKRVLCSSRSKVFSERIPYHRVIEKSSEYLYELNSCHNYFGTLFGPSKLPEGFVVTSKVEIVGRG